MTDPTWTPEQKLRKKISLSDDYADLKKRLICFINSVPDTTELAYNKIFDPVKNPKWNKLLLLALKKIKPTDLINRTLVCEFASNTFKIVVQ